MIQIHNEQLKLTANMINALCVAVIVTGVVAPLVAGLYGVNSYQQPAIASSQAAAACLFAGLVLHFAARYILRRLK